MIKPFAPAAASNRHAILDTLRAELATGHRVLEIGSGSAQHLCHFASQLPEVYWQPTDVPAALPGMRLWVDEAACDNLAEPLALDVVVQPWPELEADVCYSANTLHMISWPAVQALFRGCARILASGGKLCVYGPFAFNGRHVSDSNARFSRALQQEDPERGVRDVADLDELATAQGFRKARAIALPSNNHLLVFQH